MIDPKYFSAITEYDEERTMREQWEEGYEEGYKEGVLLALLDFVREGLLTPAQAAEAAHMTPAEFEAKTESLISE